MKKLFSNKPVIITIVAVVLLLVLAFFSAGSRTIPWVESAVGAVVRPIQTFAYKASSGVAIFFKELFNSTDADLEVSRLRQELAMNEQLKLDYDELLLENERLKALLNYAGEVGEYKYVTASVIGKSGGVWFDVITINAGRNQGVEVGQPVICGDGLVGRVTDVGANWSKVVAIIDSTFTAAAAVERTRDNCMVRGVFSSSDPSGTLELYYLPTDLTDIVPGDVIMTSGLGGMFPKGIRIGTVSEVMLDADSSGVNAIVTPSVDFMHLEEVMIIIGTGGED